MSRPRSMAGGTVADAGERRRALDPHRSFIVQAPAGSGKTELLIRRFLALLATVSQPEEILAITFTRKAAGEMRERVLAALDNAASPPPANGGHERELWDLGRTVLERDRELGWQLESTPDRLRVMTIDALNALLARRMPVRSGTGGGIRIADRPDDAYRDAARRTLMCVGDGDEAGERAAGLLRHLDNSLTKAEDLLVSLLRRRDHWEPLVHPAREMSDADRRTWLERGIRRLIEDGLRRAREVLPVSAAIRLVELAAAAAERLPEDKAASPVAACRGLAVPPEAGEDHVAAWRGLVALLLTDKGSLRKRLDKNLGFPPGARADKEAMAALLEELESALNPDALARLAAVAELPDPGYDDVQWRALSTLLEVLPRAAGELRVTFRERGETDYVEVARSAAAALGTPEEPTDLSLALDYAIRHVLVDEFQDTSWTQHGLIQQLTAGWEPDDGRTLFCVGDPMQSIYRFREAEVGLYLQARAEGIGPVRLEPLTLRVNFRSDSGIVDWVNRVFAEVMPATEDMGLGAVTYSTSTAFREEGEADPVRISAVAHDDRRGEAQVVADTVAGLQDTRPGATVAVLVRGRSHLVEIAPALRQAGLRFRAVEIEALGTRPVVQDLVALTRALCHLGDRTAWLSVLRAPWCGLVLPELLALAPESRGDTVWEAISAPDAAAGWPEASARRLERCRLALEASLRERGRCRLRRLVEGAWLSLGGPAAAGDETALEDAAGFFALLETLDAGGDLEDVSVLGDALKELFASPDAGAGPELQVMTIHKAKGLQFDHVVLPGLYRRTGRDNKELLRWADLPGPDGERDLILSPVEPTGEARDPLHQLLKRLEGERQGLELQRLLYVACTRARHGLTLVTELKRDEDTGLAKQPNKGTFLALLWPVLESELGKLAGNLPSASGVPVGAPSRPGLRRLVSDWTAPEVHRAVPSAATGHVPAAAGRVVFDWAGHASRAIGVAVHRCLERVAESGAERWQPGDVDTLGPVIEAILRERGLSGGTLAESAAATSDAVRNALADERGRWILSGKHGSAQCELAMSGVDGSEVVHVVIDRTFVDEDGVRWIVDYKTGRHTGADLDGFLDEEVARYREQLETYARLMRRLEPDRPIRLALYFPVHRAWRTWRPADSDAF